MKKIRCHWCGKIFDVDNDIELIPWHTPPCSGLFGVYDTCDGTGAKEAMTSEEKIAWINRPREEIRATNFRIYKETFQKTK